MSLSLCVSLELTNHVVASIILLNVQTASRTRFCSNCPDQGHRFPILVLLDLVAVPSAMLIPWSVTFHIELEIAVRTFNPILENFVTLGVLNRE